MSLLQNFPSLTTLSGSSPAPHIFHLCLNRPKRMNAMNPTFFEELKTAFTYLNKCEDLRVVVVTGNGKHFCAGLDLQETNLVRDQDQDMARQAIKGYDGLKYWQDCIDQLSSCRVPVICAVHGACVGGGLDLITSADIRLCTRDAKFTIKEVDIGICADLGTPQRIIHLTGNDSMIRELTYTGRFFSGKEALQLGLVSKVCENEKELKEDAMKMAKNIAEKSPVAIWTIKQVLNHDRNKVIRESLDFVARINMSMINTTDLQEAIRANLTKRRTNFPKL